MTTARDSPLRPELIEAIFYLSLAMPGDVVVFEMAGSLTPVGVAASVWVGLVCLVGCGPDL